jgi:hypothetical protein
LKKVKTSEPWPFVTHSIILDDVTVTIDDVTDETQNSKLFMKRLDVKLYLSDKNARGFVYDLDDDLRVEIHKWALKYGDGHRSNASFLLVGDELVNQLEDNNPELNN